MKRFLLCTSLPLRTQIFDFACDPQPLKASVGLLSFFFFAPPLLSPRLISVLKAGV